MPYDVRAVLERIEGRETYGEFLWYFHDEDVSF